MLAAQQNKAAAQQRRAGAPRAAPLRARSVVRRAQPQAAVAEPATAPARPLRVMISGAPASGKGTQAARIVDKYGLVHISAGDLLREQVALGTPEGLRAKEFMDKGALVPDEVVVDMVKARLAQPDARQNGWLLDGYPRSGSQAEAIEREGIRPDIFLLLEVPDELLVERVVGRRMDPTTGAIYHLKYNPPPPEAVPRLVQRSDDTEEKAVARLDTHRRNVDAVMGYYADKCVPVKGDRAMAEVFSSIEQALDEALLKASDPMESFCEGNPSEPECRVYDE